METLGGSFSVDRGTALRCLFCVATFLLLDLLHATYTIAVDLRDTAAELETSVRAANNDDLPQALAHLKDAADESRDARAELDSPGLDLIGLVPAIRKELESVQAMSIAATDTARAGIASIRTTGLDVGKDLYDDGAFDLHYIQTLEVAAHDLSSDLRTTARRLNASTTPGLAVLDKATRHAHHELITAADSAARGERLLGVLPEMLGNERPQRYLLAFQSPSEARGGGGLIGVYAILTVADGRVDLGPVTPIQDLNADLRSPVSAPRWFRRLYGDLTALDDARQVNLSPTFPTTARQLLRMYRRAEGDVLDGVIAMDPVVLGKMTRAVGHLHGDGWNVRIGAQNARRLLLRDIYLRFGRALSRPQNRYLGGLVSTLWDKLEAGTFKKAPLLDALSDSAATQHLKVFVRDPGVAAVLSDLELDGDPDAGGDNVQMFFHNNFGGNKIDYFIGRRIRTSVTFDGAGNALFETEVDIHNRAENSPVTLLTRPLDKRLPNGYARMTVHLLLPRSAVVTGERISDSGRDFFTGSEDGRPIVWDSIGLRAGASTTIGVTYCVPNAVDPTEGGSFSLTLWPQATVHPDSFSVAVARPEGFELSVPDEGRRLPDGGIQVHGVMKTPRRIGITLSPAGSRPPQGTATTCRPEHRTGRGFSST